jgi:hypothetical protein
MVCSKCGTELIGSKKFCAACGAPAEPVREPVAAPRSQVDPFASTSKPMSEERVSSYGPPPPIPDPAQAPTSPAAPMGLGLAGTLPVSPLASSHFDLPSSDGQGPLPPPAAISPMPPRVPSQPDVPPPSEQKGQPGTVVMGAIPFSQMVKPPSANQPVAPPASSVAQPPRPVQPAPSSGFGPPPAHAPSHPLPVGTFNPPAPPSAYNPAPAPPQPPQPPPSAYHPAPAQQPPPSAYNPAQPPQQAGWGAPPGYPAAPAPPPPAGFAPGTRVMVTWSNGQRYPATVWQVSQGRCLVAFPDGQQHWVDVSFLAPG